MLFFTTEVIKKFPVGSKHLKSSIWKVFFSAFVPCCTLRLDCELYLIAFPNTSIGIVAYIKIERLSFFTTGMIEKCAVCNGHIRFNIMKVFLTAVVPCCALRLSCERYSLLMLDLSTGRSFPFGSLHI